MTDRTPRRQAESSRVEAFRDGVFSIAITLLVLELAVPTVRGDFGTRLVDEAITYVAYLAAFANIGVLWMGHHTLFTRIVGVDPGLLWRNLVLLLIGHLREHRNLLDAEADPRFFRLAELLVTLVGYGAAAVVGLFYPGLALAVFLVFPIIYVVRIRSGSG